MDLHDLYFGSSPALREALAQAEDLAPTPFPVLALGPTGSGKTVLARYIHELSGRRGEFVECSLSEMPEPLRHTILAGHARGAFTGAVESSPGLVEVAHGGTLFLDELHLATADLRSYLLQVLERPYSVRLRDTRKRYVDVRFLFATNRDPLELRRNGTWGDDFFFRLGYNYIRLPSLAERRDEILPLAVRFLGRCLAAAGKAWQPRFAPEAEQWLLSHSWPGNLRELMNVCQCAASRLPEDRPIGLGELPRQVAEAVRRLAPDEAEAFREEQVDAVLRDVKGNKSAAARRLEISRQSLDRLIKRRNRHSGNGDPHRPT